MAADSQPPTPTAYQAPIPASNSQPQPEVYVKPSPSPRPAPTPAPYQPEPAAPLYPSMEPYKSSPPEQSEKTSIPNCLVQVHIVQY